MRLNTALLRWGMRRLMAGRSPALTEVATRSWEICPAETATIPPAIHLEDTMDRVTQLSPWCNWETERALIKGGQTHHAASTAHLVEDVDLSGAYLYRGAARAQPGYGAQRLLVREPGGVARIETAHLMSNWAGSHFFGSYMRDDLPLGLLPPEDANPITVVNKAYDHEAGYRALFDLPRPPRVAAARIGQLTLYRDFAQNSSKEARYRELRARLRARIARPAERPAERPAGIYLKRGATGEQRLVANEAALEAALAALGFDIVEPARLQPEEIAEQLLDAPVIVSVEGSHLAHTMYTLAEHGTLLVLQPPDRFALPYKAFTDRLDMRFAFVVGHPAEDGFSVDLDELKRVLDLVT